MKRPRLLRITTVPISLKLLLNGQLSHFANEGFEVLAVSSSGPEIVDGKIDGIRHRSVQMTRRITPLQDLICLLEIISIIREFKPDIIHSHTPKAGLLGMIAGWMCRIPVRMHTVAGLPLMEKSGLTRKILNATEKITYSCATHVFPNSFGLLEFIHKNISRSPKLSIIGRGSSNGIDTRYYRRDKDLVENGKAIRKQYGVSDGDIVYGFVGRVVRDKGISELVHAFKRCREQLSPDKNLFLLIVGPLEQDLDPLSEGDLSFLESDKHVILAGYQNDVRPWIIASDIFVFPSYREGFPNVVMQACCLETPCIVSDINGCNEIIRHDATGLIVRPKDSESLASAMISLATTPGFRDRFAAASRDFVVANYDQQFVWDEIGKRYRDALNVATAPGSSWWYRSVIKPFLDFVVALTALLIASPIIVLCILLLYFANNGKVWFTQRRPGFLGRPFYVVKFKTMNDRRDASGELLPDDQRLTRVGKFIRKTSLDELPQLINVIKGDMSFVGPRPLLEEYMPLYNAEQQLRHSVKPGITGWAQVNGRNAIAWGQKFALDVWYIRHQSFLLDLKIIFKTIAKVFKAEGINSATSVTMERWRGNSSDNQ